MKQKQAFVLMWLFVCVCVCLQLEFERSQVRRLEKEQWRATEQLEEERAQHRNLSCALAKECKWASARALEEGHRLTELSHKLDKVFTLFKSKNLIVACFLFSKSSTRCTLSWFSKISPEL